MKKKDRLRHLYRIETNHGWGFGDPLILYVCNRCGAIRDNELSIRNHVSMKLNCEGTLRLKWLQNQGWVKLTGAQAHLLNQANIEAYRAKTQPMYASANEGGLHLAEEFWAPKAYDIVTTLNLPAGVHTIAIRMIHEDRSTQQALVRLHEACKGNNTKVCQRLNEWIKDYLRSTNQEWKIVYFGLHLVGQRVPRSSDNEEEM